MRATALARRYARALLESAADAGKMEEVAGELEAFVASLDQVPKLRLILLSPEIERSKKRELVERLADGRFSDLFLRFLTLLIHTGRESLLPEIRTEYSRLLDRKLGRIRAETTTAVPLEEELVEQLGRNMSEMLGAEVKLRTRVDPDILGGVVIRVDGKVYDASLRRRLERMREELLAASLPGEQNVEVRDGNQT